MQLGDKIHNALRAVGITPERVEQWVGGPCGCQERQEKLNQLGRWAARILRGSTDRAKEYLDAMMS